MRVCTFLPLPALPLGRPATLVFQTTGGKKNLSKVHSLQGSIPAGSDNFTPTAVFFLINTLVFIRFSWLSQKKHFNLYPGTGRKRYAQPAFADRHRPPGFTTNNMTVDGTAQIEKETAGDASPPLCMTEHRMI